MPSLSQLLPYAVPASAQLLSANRYLQLAIDMPDPVLHACWLGEIDQADLREGVDTVVRAVQEYGISKLLNDNRQLTTLDMEAVDWQDIKALERLHTAGLHYIAWVYANDPQARCLADETMARNSWPLTLTFEEYDVAIDWLQHMP